MANLLANPELWAQWTWDGSATPPPDAWVWPAYDWDTSSGAPIPALAYAGSPPVEGDTLAGTARVMPESGLEGLYLIVVDGDGQQVFDPLWVEAHVDTEFEYSLDGHQLGTIFLAYSDVTTTPGGIEDTGYYSLIITEEPGELVANNDQATTPEGVQVAIPVLANDTLNGTPVTVGELDWPPIIVAQPANGGVVVETSGVVLYTPQSGFFGADTFEYEISAGFAGTSRATVTVTVLQGPSDACEEIGPVTRAYVSAYQRTRAHHSRLVRGERRCLVADLNGAIPLSRTIVSATWRTYTNHTAILSESRINGREVEVNVTAGYGGRAAIKLEATLDNGEQYVQTFVVEVQGTPWFPGEQQVAAGPTVLTVEA